MFQKASGHSAGNEVLVQEIVPGDGHYQFSSCMFFKDNKAIGSMEAQRWRQHPPEFGRAATYVESLELPIVEELTLKFLSAINYYGLAEVEYKLDSRDGKYKLLDVNARTWGFHCLGGPAGVDFSYMLYADQIGKSIENCRGKPGVGWMRMVTDFPTSLSGLLRRRLSLRSYWDSISHTGVESVFSREDILPSLMEILLIPYIMVKRGY
jgi:D-aspartate ligase